MARDGTQNIDMQKGAEIIRNNPEIGEELIALGIDPGRVGFMYLVCAISFTTRDTSYLNTLTARLYPDVAKVFSTTGSSVERGIRSAIERSFDTLQSAHRDEMFCTLANPDTGRPTNSTYIARVTFIMNRKLVG